MNYEQRIVWVTIALIVGVVISSGPLVGAINLTSTQGGPAPPSVASEDEQLNVSVLSLPSTVTLKQTTGGSEAYALRVPNATVQIEHVHGNPPLVFRFSIPDLSYTSGTLHYVSEDEGHQVNVTTHPQTIAQEKVTRDQYTATLTIVARVNATERTIAHRNATVVVKE